MSVLSKPYFHDEALAFEHLEATLWPSGPVCPHCGTIGRATKLQGKATRLGLWKCNERECRKQFTVKVGTVFEHGRMPLNKMLQAVYLLSCSKKGVSSHQLHRILEIQYKSAWFLSHRIREAMRDGSLAPLGGAGKVVEADETYYGDKDVVTKRTKRGRAAHSSKRSIVALVERGGSVRAFHVEHADQPTVGRIMNANIAREAAIHTDESRLYGHVPFYFAEHHTVVHSHEEYVRYEGDRTVHTNTIEGYFSVFKRGMRGVYQHCAEKHLHRYLAEFDFRYNTRAALGTDDKERAALAMKGIAGKRLTYRRPHAS